MHQQSHSLVKEIEDIVVQLSPHADIYYGMLKSAEKVFKRKMFKEKEPVVPWGKIWALDSDQQESCSFLEVQQAGRNKPKKVHEILHKMK